MGASIAVLYGVVSYLLFLVAFLYAIGFTGNFIVPKGIDDGAAGSMAMAIIVNIVLLLIFALQHNIMARPAFKRWWTKFVPQSVERSTFVLFASLALLLLYWQWQPMTGSVWSVQAELWRTILWVVFALGWAIVLVSTFMIGHFELFGLTQVFNKMTGKVEGAAAFKEPGFYKIVRHPIMVGFIVAFWATPDMTAGHLLFAVVTTAWILISIQLEERDLIVMLGMAYTEYRKRVPALIPFTKFGGGKDTQD
ncbi:MAG: methyltransferase [Alphaproteobacteria bacterium]|nr:methyltransferase [Alphaproteobacteria bacterium]